jgi:hypothetical protein
MIGSFERKVELIGIGNDLAAFCSFPANGTAGMPKTKNRIENCFPQFALIAGWMASEPLLAQSSRHGDQIVAAM